MDARNEKRRSNRIELVFHDVHDHGTDIAQMWINEVEIRTGGRVEFTRTLGDTPELIEAADLVRDVPASDTVHPLLNLVQLPFTFPDSTTGSRVIARLYGEFPALRRELSGEKVVGLGTGAMMAVFSNRLHGPIRTLEDFRNVSIRSLSIMDEVFKAFGALPQKVGWFEMSGKLEKGELDAVLLGILPAYRFGLADKAAPFCTLAGSRSITMHPMRIYMKWNTWDKLPDDVRRVIEELGPSGEGCWFTAANGKDSDSHLEKALDYFRQKGEIVYITPEELERWREKVKPVIDSTLDKLETKRLPARRFFSRMLELVEEYSQ